MYRYGHVADVTVVCCGGTYIVIIEATHIYAIENEK